MPMKFATKRLFRAIRDRRRSGAADCWTTPSFITTILIRHHERFALVVGYVDRGYTQLLLDPPELKLHFFAQFSVECRERLIEQAGGSALNDSARLRWRRAVVDHQITHAGGGRSKPSSEFDQVQELAITSVRDLCSD